MREQISQAGIHVLLLLLCLTMLEACGTEAAKDDSEHQQASQKSKRPPAAVHSDPLSPPDCFAYNADLIGAWEAFASEEHYRKALPGDFNLPDWVLKDRSPAVEGGPKISGTCIGGAIDLNRDGVWNDFAAIVVDLRSSGSDKFALVIFTGPRKRGQPYGHTWLFKGKDLSRYELFTLSASNLLAEYHDDGSSLTYVIAWDAVHQRFYASPPQQ